MTLLKNITNSKQINSDIKRILEKYPDRIPVITERVSDDNNGELTRYKYLVPQDFTVAQFLVILREKISLSPSHAIFIYVNRTIPMSSETIGQIHQKYADPDGMLHIKYALESTYGH